MELWIFMEPSKALAEKDKQNETKIYPDVLLPLI